MSQQQQQQPPLPPPPRKQQQQLQLQQKHQEMRFFLNKIMDAHDNAIRLYYQNRDYISTRYVLIQILTDLQKLEQYNKKYSIIAPVEGVTNAETPVVLMLNNNHQHTIRPIRLSTNTSTFTTTTTTTTTTAIVHNEDFIDVVDANGLTEDVESLSSSLLQQQQQQQQQQQHEEQCTESELDDSGNEIYDGAIVFGYIDSSNTNITDGSIELYEIAVIVMFNLALVHQLLYLEGDMQELIKSIRIYHQVISVLEGSVYLSKCTKLQLLLCASNHNCAQMYLSDPTISNFHYASILLDNVQNTLCYILHIRKEVQAQQQQQRQQELTTIIPKDDEKHEESTTLLSSNELEQYLQFFYRNLILARFTTQNGHSAAA